MSLFQKVLIFFIPIAIAIIGSIGKFLVSFIKKVRVDGEDVERAWEKSIEEFYAIPTELCLIALGLDFAIAYIFNNIDIPGAEQIANIFGSLILVHLILFILTLLFSILRNYKVRTYLTFCIGILAILINILIVIIKG